MSMQLVSDGCVDHSPLFDKNPSYGRAEFKVSLDDKSLEQDSTLASLVKRLTATAPKVTTAAPSPFDFLETLLEPLDSFIVTISSKLSGSFQNASIAAREFKTMNPDQKIHVFDSQSASAGETLVFLKVKELLDEGILFDSIITKVNSYIENLKTFFILDSLDTLHNAGRITNMKAMLGKILRIIPIMGEDGKGSIMLKAQIRGEAHAENKLLDLVRETNKDFANTNLAITHVNALSKATTLKDRFENELGFQNIHIFEASNLSTVYAGEGGIVLAF